MSVRKLMILSVDILRYLKNIVDERYGKVDKTVGRKVDNNEINERTDKRILSLNSFLNN